MPRASFSDVQTGGLGFKEGRVLITESYSTIYQFPPNSKTKEQSDPFPALVWKGVKLDKDGNPITDADGKPEDAEIIHRMGSINEQTKEFDIRPGKLEPKDFDNLDAIPEDLGSDVGVQGNSFFLEDGAKFSRNWGFMDETLKKHGFKPEILGRCVTTDFVGMDLHMKHEEGAPYVAKSGKNKGQEVKPSNLVVTRIFPPFPYEAGAGKKADAAKKAQGLASTATGAGKIVPNTQAGVAGAAAVAGTPAASDALTAAKNVLGTASDNFKKAVKAGDDKGVSRVDFQKALTAELMRQKLNPKTQKEVMDLVKNDDGLFGLAGELVDQPGAFSTDGTVVTFS